MNSEYCLLGIVLNNHELFPRLLKNIFLNSKCIELYYILEAEWKRSKGFVKENILELIKDNPKLNEEDFFEIYDSAFEYDKFDQYYNFVLSNWSVIQADNKIKELRSCKYTSIVDVKNNLQDIIKDLSVNDEMEIIDSKEVVMEIINDIGENKKIELIKSHINYIDYYGGLEKGDVIIIAARPGIGKSSRMYNMVLQDMYFKIPVGIFSLEAKRKKLLKIMGCLTSGINSEKLRKSELDDKERELYINAYNKVYENLPPVVDDTNNLESIKRKAKILKDNKNIQKIYIDYLGLIETQEGRTRYEKVSHISREIKKLAMDLELPIIALHQLNRESENRQDKKPRMADLRDSGSIEQDADIIILLHQIITDMNKPNEVVLEHIIEKFREGAVGISKAIFNKPNRRIEEWDNTEY